MNIKSLSRRLERLAGKIETVDRPTLVVTFRKVGETDEQFEARTAAAYRPKDGAKLVVIFPDEADLGAC